MTFLILAALAAAQPAPEPIGRRTQTPAQLLAQYDPAAEDEALIAAAAAHPLGSMENPVRVGGPDGARAYLARLRCADGNAPRIGASSSLGIGAFGSVVEGFPLDCGSAEPAAVTLVLDLYHQEHAEDRAPSGFTILPR